MSIKKLKPYLYLLVYIFLSIIFIGLTRDTGNAIFQNLWLWGTFIVFIKRRHEIADWFLSFKRVPVLLGFILFSYPFMLVEENINCLSTCKLVPITIPFLTIYLLLIYWVVKKFNIKKFWPVLTIFCALGVLFELAFGYASAEFQALPPASFVVAFFLIWIMYAYITIIPLTYLLKKRKQQGNI